MNDIIKRREISARIADPADIPVYRQLLKAADSPFAGYIETNKNKLARLLVSALLDTMTEEDILRAVKRPSEAAKTAENTPTAPSAAPATAAVKKKPNPRQPSTRTSGGMTWTTLWSALRTASSRIRSTLAAGWEKLKRGLATPWRPLNSSRNT